MFRPNHRNWTLLGNHLTHFNSRGYVLVLPIASARTNHLPASPLNNLTDKPNLLRLTRSKPSSGQSQLTSFRIIPNNLREPL